MERLIECLGGPSDGDQVRDRGEFWMVIGVIREDGEIEPGSAGTYVREGAGYRWHPMPEDARD